MNHRMLLSVMTSACLSACLAKTTSLGGPDGTQASASSTTDEDGSVSTDAGVDHACYGGVSWRILAEGDVACEYPLPSGDAPSGDPRHAPATWNTCSVTIDVLPAHDGEPKRVGRFVHSSDMCAGDDGWYYVAPTDGGAPTHFAVCPKTCGSVESEGAELRLTATTCCK